MQCFASTSWGASIDLLEVYGLEIYGRSQGMRIVHTSDWHLGQNFMFHDRREEHSMFLKWLLDRIKELKVDLLIISGDIFDTGTPPNYAEELYYRFLADVAGFRFCQVIVIGGNHDSISLLNSSKKVLKLINTHVVAAPSDNITDDIIVIKREDEGIGSFNKGSFNKYDMKSEEESNVKHEPEPESDNVMGIVCCIPFLRERYIRSSVAGESIEDKSKASLEGIRRYYSKMYQRASCMREEIAQNRYSDDGNLSAVSVGRMIKAGAVPIIATGHLFAAGSISTDGVREISIGNIEHVDVDAMDIGFDYVALGHLHRPQIVAKKEYIRYSGSPVPLSFSESDDQKQITVVDFKNGDSAEIIPEIRALQIPSFRKLKRVEGDMDEIEAGVKALKSELNRTPDMPVDKIGELPALNDCWLEVKYTGEEFISDLKSRIEKQADHPEIVLFNVIDMNGARRRAQIENDAEGYHLDELSENEIFSMRLKYASVSDEISDELSTAFNELLAIFNTEIDQADV